MTKYLDILLSGGIMGAPKWAILFLLTSITMGCMGLVWEGLYTAIAVSCVAIVYTLIREK